jgi:hypothetical protein
MHGITFLQLSIHAVDSKNETRPGIVRCNRYSALSLPSRSRAEATWVRMSQTEELGMRSTGMDQMCRVDT